MKMYEGPGGQFYGTQTDAKKACGRENFTEVEVPTDKWGLISYLNQRANAYSDLRPAPQPLPETTLTFCQEAAAAPVSAFERAQTNISIETEIEKADFPRSINIAAAALSRVQEHVNDLGKTKTAIADLMS